MMCTNCIHHEEGDCAQFSGSKETPLYSQQFLDECNDNHKIPQKTARHIQICSDEIVSNIVKYGHANTIHIRYKVDNNAVILEYEDDGALYDPLESSTPDITLSAAERKIGGLGLFMVKKIASFVEYAEKEGWNTLRLTFEFDPNEFL